jgi:hypothetical protein
VGNPRRRALRLGLRRRWRRRDGREPGVELFGGEPSPAVQLGNETRANHAKAVLVGEVLKFKPELYAWIDGHAPILMREREMTRDLFEAEFGLVLPGEAIGCTIHGVGGETVHITLIGLRQFEIQELERLYKLQGDQ